MQLVKNNIRKIAVIQLITIIFTFSVVFAKDDSIYVWSSQTESFQANANIVEDNAETKKSKIAEETNESETKLNDTLNLQSSGAILIEQKSGKVLYNHNAHEKLRPASVTKVMSILLIMEALDSGRINLTDKVPCTEDAAGMGGSQIWLEVGEELTVDEMLKAICVVSANDCAEQLRHLLNTTDNRRLKNI